jgi:hypothetical protein
MLRLTLLACVMVLAQTALALHDVEHLGHVEQDQCETCVAGASLGAAQVAAGLRPVPCARPPASQSTAIARPALRATFNAHPPRAPPGDTRHGPC